MEITLEKIELVKDRTGVSYKEAKDALEKTEGNVVDAIILIEDSIDEGPQSGENKATEVVENIKEIVKKGNISKILIKRDGEVVLNLPVSIGIVGTVLFPWAAIAGTIAAFGTKCEIEIIKDDGEVIDVSNKANEAVETAKSKSGVVIDEMKDKGAEAWDFAKGKGMEAFDMAKEKGKDAFASFGKKDVEEFVEEEVEAAEEEVAEAQTEEATEEVVAEKVEE